MKFFILTKLTKMVNSEANLNIHSTNIYWAPNKLRYHSRHWIVNRRHFSWSTPQQARLSDTHI